jgi:hypothetical protein
MSNKSNKGFTVKHQGTALMCLAVAFVIAGGSYFVGTLAGEENTTPKEVTPNESIESKQDPVGAVQAGYRSANRSIGTLTYAGDSGGSGKYDHIVLPKHCYLVVGFTDDYPELNESNALTVPIGLCVQIAEALFRREAEDLEHQ